MTLTDLLAGEELVSEQAARANAQSRITLACFWTAYMGVGIGSECGQVLEAEQGAEASGDVTLKSLKSCAVAASD